jgi:hypothetical protein
MIFDLVGLTIGPAVPIAVVASIADRNPICGNRLAVIFSVAHLEHATTGEASDHHCGRVGFFFSRVSFSRHNNE